MKNFFKKISLKIILFVFIFSSFSAFSQTNKKVHIEAEKVDEGIKVTTVEDGKKTVKVFNLKDAEEYLKQFGDNINIDLEETSDNNYKFTYSTEGGEEQTIEINLEEMITNLSLSFDNLTEDLEDVIEQISSSVEYEETVDKNGNKVIKIKSIKAVK